MRSEKMVRRWSKLARATHWLLLLGVTIGFITGLPVFDGKLFGFIYNVLGGEEVRETLHYYVTIILLAPAIPLIIARAIQARGEEWWWPSWREIRDAFTVMARWLGITKKYPLIGFHHPIEKLFLLLVHFGVLLLGISGILMVFDILGVRYKAVLLLIHDIGFIMTAIPLAGHFMLAINPLNWETLRAILTHGMVSEKWARRHHPGWRISEAEADKPQHS